MQMTSAEQVKVILKDGDYLDITVPAASEVLKVWVKNGIGLAVLTEPSTTPVGDAATDEQVFNGYGWHLSSNAMGDPVIVDVKGLSHIYICEYSNRGHASGINGMTNEFSFMWATYKS